VIYFKLRLEQQEMSNLTYQIPEQNMLLIQPVQTSDEYYGIIDDMWYSELMKSLPRQILDSLDVISPAEFSRFLQLSQKQADQRRFAGNINLLPA
jgi:hypothetical protein